MRLVQGDETGPGRRNQLRNPVITLLNLIIYLFGPTLPGRRARYLRSLSTRNAACWQFIQMQFNQANGNET